MALSLRASFQMSDNHLVTFRLIRERYKTNASLGTLPIKKTKLKKAKTVFKNISFDQCKNRAEENKEKRKNKELKTNSRKRTLSYRLIHLFAFEWDAISETEIS